MIKVLIVEDDPMVAEINKRYLQKDSRIGSIEICNNGANALSYLMTSKADLVLLDVFMPKLSGLDLLKKIREKNLDTDVILVTASNNKESLETAFRLGAIDYLVKPFEYERFCSAINSFFSKRNMLKGQDSVFSQKVSDQLFSSVAGTLQPNAKESLEKGIQPQTLDLLISFFKEHNGEKLSSSEISEAIGLSRVTVHKYLNFMERSGQLKSEIDYKTEGRPKTCYYIDDDII